MCLTWWHRYQEQGEAGLQSHSRRRKTLPEPKITPSHEQAILFKEQVLPGFCFPVQRIQTDRGPEFIGEAFQRALRDSRVEFWPTVDCRQPLEALAPALAQWLRYYNEVRGHSSLGAKTPRRRLEELFSSIPSGEAVELARSRRPCQSGVKKSLLVEEGGGPLAVCIAANSNDATLLKATLDAIVVERP